VEAAAADAEGAAGAAPCSPCLPPLETVGAARERRRRAGVADFVVCRRMLADVCICAFDVVVTSVHMSLRKK
jgi:hypothetical protein